MSQVDQAPLETEPESSRGSTHEPARSPSAAKSSSTFVSGFAGQGKTELAYMLFDSYPGDKVLIDPNHDVKVPDDAEEIEAPTSPRWPRDTRTGADRKKPRFLYFLPDFESPTYIDDMDRVVGMAFAHGNCCLMVDECHEVAPATKTPPHTRRALRHRRHQDLTTIWATPRTMTVDPLTLANSDWCYFFDLPLPQDRKRAAECIGWDEKTFSEGIDSLGQFEYLRFDRARRDLAHFPPLPERYIKHHKG